MKKICIGIVIALLICPAVYSATKTTAYEVKGRGHSKEDAINKALAEAVAKAKGAIVSSQDYRFDYQSATADVERKDNGGKEVSFDAVSVKTGGSAIATNIGGLVKTYEVLSEQKIDDSTYEVTLKVWVYDYESGEQANRQKLAVMPIRVMVQDAAWGTQTLSGENISSKFSDKLNAGFTQTNKFAVVDRAYMAEAAHERNLLISGDSSLEEKAKVGQALGADYILVGTISDLRLKVTEKTSPAIGSPIKEYDVDFVFEYRVVAAPTRLVKMADTITIRLKTEDVKKLVKEWKPNELDINEMLDNFLTNAASQVVTSVIDQLYPIRIASISSDGQIVINQGGKKLVRGMLLDVVRPGKEITDFDTKESLGNEEIFVATIQVQDVKANMSYATVLAGKASDLAEGLICRNKTAQAAVDMGAKSNVKQSEN